MRTLIISAAILSLAAAPALAQPAQNGQHGQWGSGDQGMMTDSGGWHGQQGPGEHHDMMRHMMMRHMWHRMHERSGDTFRFKKGDATIDIHCSSQQPVQVCVEAATRIMQGITQMSQAHHGQSASQAGGGASSSSGMGTGTTRTH